MNFESWGPRDWIALAAAIILTVGWFLRLEIWSRILQRDVGKIENKQTDDHDAVTILKTEMVTVKESIHTLDEHCEHRFDKIDNSLSRIHEKIDGKVDK